MANVVDVDKGGILGRWICENPKCGSVVVVREGSRFVRPPEDGAERCSCRFCCPTISGRGGTVRWEPEPSNVIPFRGLTP